MQPFLTSKNPHRQADVALGISTHGFSELSVALGLQPSYVSFGPVFGTKSKSDVGFEAQTVAGVKLWRSLIGDKVPFMVIGGVSKDKAAGIFKEGERVRRAKRRA